MRHGRGPAARSTMNTIHREFFDVSRSDEWRLHIIGDVHLGNKGCNEAALLRTVNVIAADPRALWIGMGDYAEFINVSDPRFRADSLARWVKVSHLVDLSEAQRERFLRFVTPIADKCLALVEGNHERTIQRYYERNIYSEIVTGVKAKAGLQPTDILGLGYSGWVVLHFYRSNERKHATVIKLNLHHGHATGRKLGGKVNALQDRLWTHDADLVIMNHCHDEIAASVAVQSVRGDKVVNEVRKGVYGGTFLADATYSEEKGYPPQPVDSPVIILKPGVELQEDRIRIVV